MALPTIIQQAIVDGHLNIEDFTDVNIDGQGVLDKLLTVSYKHLQREHE